MKKFSIVPIIALIAILTAACEGNASPQTPPEPAPTAQSFPSPTPLPAPTDTALPTETSAPTAESNVGPAVSFSADVMPILQAKCNECHGIEKIKEGLDMTTYEGVIKGSFNGPVVVPGNAGESLVVQMIVEDEMPKRGTKATPDELQILMNWVNQGALNN